MAGRPEFKRTSVHVTKTTTTTVLGLMSFLYFKIIAPKLKNFGSIRLESEENGIKYCKLGFQNIKELKVFSKELFFFRDCKNFESDFNSYNAKGFMISSDLFVGKRPSLDE